MGRKKGGSQAKNGRDGNPKYLGVKYYDGQKVKSGTILLRQRGSTILPGDNVKLGTDFSIFALKDGEVKFERKGKDRKKISIL